MDELRRKADEEALGLSMAAIKPTTSGSGQQQQQQQSKGGQSKVKKLHKACGKIHFGGDDYCWVLHPEKKPKRTKEKDSNNNNSSSQKPQAQPSRAILNQGEGLSASAFLNLE